MSDAITLLRRFVLALAVYREARGESLEGKRLVAQTIENRVRDPRWPDTYVGVITQPWQFSAFNKNDPNALVFPSERDPQWPDCVEAADVVLSAPMALTDANHYCRFDVYPAWRNDRQMVASEGHHRFFKL